MTRPAGATATDAVADAVAVSRTRMPSTPDASPAALARPAACIVVVGPLPPPWHGGTVATDAVLRSRLAERYRVLHLDTSDRRGLENLGRLDPVNVLLALAHCARMIRLLVTRWPAAVYVPIAQNTLGVLRDAALIVPALALRRRVVLHVHGGGLRDFHDTAPAPVRLLLRLLLARAARVIVLGQRLRPMLDGLTRPERIAVLPNGADDPFGDVPVRSGAPPLRVLFLGNLIRAKGFLDVMQAVLLLRQSGVQVELDLAGAFHEAADRAAADDLAGQLGGALRMHGVVERAEKLALLRSADVLAFPSYYPNEGHPYVVLEAMAAGLPVVATPHAGIADTVVEGVTGLLVPPQDPAALAEALRSLAADPDRRRGLGAAGRRRFEEHYSFVRWSEALERIVTDALP